MNNQQPSSICQKTVKQIAFQYIGKIITGFVSLLQGMGVTIHYFINPAKIVTQQYPENRNTLVMMDRFRGHLVMKHNVAGEPLCIGCGICEKACPNGTISVLTTKDHNGRKILGRYIYRFSQCSLCNLCVESCPYGAISMGKDYELAVYDRKFLTFILNKTAGQNPVFSSSNTNNMTNTESLLHEKPSFSYNTEARNH